MKFYLLIFILVTFSGKIESAKILAVFLALSISHHIFFRHITQELAKRDHEVTVITPDPAFPKGQSPANLTEIDIHHESYDEYPRGHLSQLVGTKNSIYSQLLLVFNMFITLFEKQVKNQEVINLFGKKFDVILMEPCVRLSATFSYIFKAPVIGISSFSSVIGLERIFGVPYHPLFYPCYVQQRLYNLTIWEKIREIYLNLWAHHIFIDIERRENKMLQNMFGQDVPLMSNLMNNIELMFINVQAVWIDNQPMSTNVIFMGGLHKPPLKTLPKDLQTYLDSSSKDIIYVSFGSNISPSKLESKKIKMVKKVFSELPYNFLWKWDLENRTGLSDNIKISKWLPQSDIIRHPKVKLFITQGGLQSTEEAIDAEIPMIGLPMLLDQWYNTEKYEHHKIGIKLELEELTEEKLRRAINDIIGNESYKRNIKKLKFLINDTPLKPLDSVMWWIEYVLRHGSTAHLRSPAANISWMEYLELELLLTILTAALGIVVVIMYIFHRIYCFISHICYYCEP